MFLRTPVSFGPDAQLFYHASDLLIFMKGFNQFEVKDLSDLVTAGEGLGNRVAANLKYSSCFTYNYCEYEFSPLVLDTMAAKLLTTHTRHSRFYTALPEDLEATLSKSKECGHKYIVLIEKA